MKLTVIAKKCTKNCNMQHKFKLYSFKYLPRFLFICAIYIVIHVGSTISKDTFMNSSVTEKPAIIHWAKLKTKLDCHYSVENDALASADDPRFSPGNNSIFFHETSCRGGINSREACAVESAARLHPKRQVNLLFSSPITDTMLRNSSLMKLLEFSNVKLSRVHVQEYGKGTVVEKILSKDLKKSSHPIEHASDILRIVTLHKYGGLYLDTDSILVKNLDSFPPNWIAKESDKDIASGIMAFSKDAIGSSLTTDILTYRAGDFNLTWRARSLNLQYLENVPSREIRNTYRPKGWSVNGPKAIQRVLKRLCPRRLTKSDHCRGVRIFPPESFYPIPYKKHRSYFKNGTISNIKKAHMLHMWNFLTRNLVIEKGSPFAKIARKVCPTIYKMYGDEFGK